MIETLIISRDRFIVQFKLILMLVLIHGVRKLKNLFHHSRDLLIDQCMFKLDRKLIHGQQKPDRKLFILVEWFVFQFF
jgi:hypothetical protein